MTGPSTDIGRDLVCFIDPQTSFKAAATDYPVAADAVRVVTASVNGKSPFAMFEDKRGTSGIERPARGAGSVGISPQSREVRPHRCRALAARRGGAALLE